MRISQIYYYSVVLLTKKYEPHNQRYPYSSSDNINAGSGSNYGPINAKLFCKQKHDFKKAERDPNININTNTNSADSSSTSDATAENTNNITNSATASSNQNQNACAVAVTCPEGSTTVTVGVTPPPADPCPHSPYTDFSGGLCQNGAPTLTCASLPGAADDPEGPDANNKCRQEGQPGNDAFTIACLSTGGGHPEAGGRICVDYPATIQTCPPPQGSTQTPTVVNGRCTIQPGAT